MASEKKFAPGPYRFERDMIKAGDKILAFVADGDNTVWFTDLEDQEAIATGKLFAAAPDLYEALEALLPCLEATEHPSTWLAVEMGKARKALARARGEEA